MHGLLSSVKIQASPDPPEHPWELDEVLGAGKALGCGCKCPVWECGFLAEHSTAAGLAGRQGGHLCAPVNEGSLHSGGMLLQQPSPARKREDKGDALCHACSGAY